MENKSKFDEVAEYLIKAHDSIFEDSDYNLPLTEDEAAQIAKNLEEAWKFYKGKYLEKGHSVSDAIKSYKAERRLLLDYCGLILEKVKGLKNEDKTKLEEFMIARGVRKDPTEVYGTYFYVYRHTNELDGIAYAFFAIKIEKTEGFKTALEKLNQALE